MSTLPDPASSRAVVIGSWRYEHLEQLPAVEENVLALANSLRDPLVWGLPEQHCRSICQPKDAAAMLDPVRQAADEATDTLLVYFSGHGLRDADSTDLYFALPSSRQNAGYTAVAYQHVRAEVRASGARRKIIIVDCCFSCRAARTLGDDADALAAQAAVDGAYVLTASPPHLVALSPQGETYTAFTGELLHLLRNGLPEGPELIDLDTVYRVLHERLVSKSRPAPQRAQENDIGRLPLVRNRARSAGAQTAAGPVLDADVRAALKVAGLNLARRLRSSSRIRDAIPVLQLALQESQTAGDGSALAIQLELSELLAETGNLRQAVDVLEQAFQDTHRTLSPEAILVCRRLADLLQEAGNHIQACEVLKHALDRAENADVHR